MLVVYMLCCGVRVEGDADELVVVGVGVGVGL